MARPTRRVPAYQALRRKVIDRKGDRDDFAGGGGCGKSAPPEDIPDSAPSLYDLRGKAAIDLVSEAADQHVDHVGLWIERIVPQPLQNHRLAEHALRIPQ